MKDFLPKLMATITGKPRYRPNVKWDKNIWIVNIFRLWEKIFGRQYGIRAEVRSAIEIRKGKIYITYELYTLEAFLAHIEVIIRSYFTLVYSFFFNSQPQLDYRPVYLTFGLLGFLFYFHTSTKFLPLFGLAIALDSANNGVATSTSPLTFSHTCTGTNLVLVVGGIAFSTVSSSWFTPSYNSVNMTQADTNVGWGSGGGDTASIYYQLNPSTGSNTVSWGFGGTSPTNNACAVSYTGVSDRDNHGNTSSAGAANPSLAITTVADNCWVVGLCGDVNTLTAGQISRWNGAVGSVNASFQDTNGVVHPAGSKTMSWTATSGAYAIILVSFSPAATLFISGWGQPISQPIIADDIQQV